MLRAGERRTLPIEIGKRPGARSTSVAKPKESRPREWRGIVIQDLPENDERFLETEGVLVKSVKEESSTARAGLSAGDVITHVGKEAIRSADDFYWAVRKMKSSVLLLTERGFFIVKPDPGE